MRLTLLCDRHLCVFVCSCCECFLVFFNDAATTEIYTYLHTLSLLDALPISGWPGPSRVLPGRSDSGISRRTDARSSAIVERSGPYLLVPPRATKWQIGRAHV